MGIPYKSSSTEIEGTGAAEKEKDNNLYPTWNAFIYCHGFPQVITDGEVLPGFFFSFLKVSPAGKEEEFKYMESWKQRTFKWELSVSFCFEQEQTQLL